MSEPDNYPEIEEAFDLGRMDDLSPTDRAISLALNCFALEKEAEVCEVMILEGMPNLQQTLRYERYCTPPYQIGENSYVRFDELYWRRSEINDMGRGLPEYNTLAMIFMDEQEEVTDQYIFAIDIDEDLPIGIYHGYSTEPANRVKDERALHQMQDFLARLHQIILFQATQNLLALPEVWEDQPPTP